MTQAEIDLAVSQATGESLPEITSRGFCIADPDVVDYDPEPPRRPLVVDWDEIDNGMRLLMPC
jgi:hypothetical protein